MKSLQKFGGIAALSHASGLVVGMALCLPLMYPLLGVAPDKSLKYLAENKTLVYLWKVVVGWGQPQKKLISNPAKGVDLPGVGRCGNLC